MSDILQATETERKATVDGAERVFKFLTAYDRAELLREFRENRRKRLIANLDAAGLPPEQKLVELENFEDQEVTEASWISFVNSALSDFVVYRRSLSKTYGAEAEEIAKAVRPSLEFKAALCGLTVGRNEPEPTEETPGPNPPTPEQVYKTPAE